MNYLVLALSSFFCIRQTSSTFGLARVGGRITICQTRERERQPTMLKVTHNTSALVEDTTKQNGRAEKLTHDISRNTLVTAKLK